MIDEIKKKALLGLHSKDNAQIYATLQDLKPIECEYQIADSIKIFAPNLDENYKAHIRQIALDLRPWRKGPFEIFDTFIDSEWQSFIKFNLLKPHLDLGGKSVCDVGCNNGYYLFRMLEMGAKKLVGIDPGIRVYMQFLFLDKFIRSGIEFEPLGVEHLGLWGRKFDTIFCLGVLYHRPDPLATLKQLKNALNPSGEVYLDTMYIDMTGDFALVPKLSYSKIPNIHFVPTISALQNWCERAKFRDFEVLETSTTSPNEQRKTEWIYGESLGEFLDPHDNTKTIEGYPAPKRVYVRIKI